MSPANLYFDEALAAETYHRTLWDIYWGQFHRHHLAVASAALVILMVLLAIAAPVVTNFTPDKVNFATRYQAPSSAHIMGTDGLGRDEFTRILYGGRISIAVGLIATTLGLLFGTLVGALGGFYGGWVDNLAMRLTDLMLALPRLFVLIIMTMMLRNANVPWLQSSGGIAAIILVIATLSWMTVARLVRGAFLSLKEKEFIEAARAQGAGNSRIIWKHLLPNAMSPIIVAGTLRVASSIITEAGLSFLGFGVQPPTPSWGNMLQNAQDEMLKGHLWLAIFPGLMIFIIVISVNYVGDGLRDALDPRKLQ